MTANVIGGQAPRQGRGGVDSGDPGLGVLTELPVRELILRLTHLADTLRVTPPFTATAGGGPARLNEDRLALQATEQDIIAELRSPARRAESLSMRREQELWATPR